MVDGPGQQEAARLDELRRRLYRPGASAQDLQRYEQDRDAQVAQAPPAPEADRPAAVRPSRRAGTITVGVLLAAAAVLALLVREGRPDAQQALPAPTAASERVTAQDIGDGEVLTIPAGAVSRPAPFPASIRGTAVVGQRYSGRGDAVVAVDPPAGPADGGRMQVTLMSAAGAAVRWRALLIVHGDDRTSYRLVAARGPAEQGPGGGSPTTFVYPAGPPTQVVVEAPAGVRWTLGVAVAEGLQPAPR